MSDLFSKIKIYSRNVFALKSSDVYLVSFPKSGNTWVRFYLCNLINNMPDSHFTDEVIGFRILDDTMPELGQSDLTKPWPHKGFPRIIKTHLSYKSVLGKHRTILVMRDPRDVMVSYFKFETTKVTPRFKGKTISEFIRDPKLGIEGWCKHYLSWKKLSGIVIKYEDLKIKDEEIFASLNKYLGVDVEQDVFLRSVTQSRFENIKKLENEKGLADPSKVGNEFKFARSGKMGQWKEIFSEDDLVYVRETLQRFLINLYDEI